MIKIVSRLDTKKSGQSLVEFALVLPILLVIIMGIFDLGFAVFATNTIANAAQEGARNAIYGSTITDTEIQNTVKASSFGLDQTKLSITITPAQAQRKHPATATVAVTYTMTLMTPFIGAFFPSGNYVTSSQATMVVEGQ